MKIKEFVQKIKNFNLIKYLLIRKERGLLYEIELQEGMIKYNENEINVAENIIISLNADIIRTGKKIELLKEDLEKIKTVIKMGAREVLEGE